MPKVSNNELEYPWNAGAAICKYSKLRLKIHEIASVVFWLRQNPFSLWQCFFDSIRSLDRQENILDFIVFFIDLQ